MRHQQSHECWWLLLVRFSGCPLFDPGWKPGSMRRDALRPDASRWLRRATEVKGGAAWRRDRSHADPPLGGEHGEHGEDPPLDRSERHGTHAGRQQRGLSTGRICPQRKVLKFFLTSDSGPRNALIFLLKKGSDGSKRAGRWE